MGVIAFQGEPSLKRAVMDRLREHRRLDQIVQGKYWEGGKGCHLGCITHADANWHSEAERLFGIEQRVGYWLEAVFEGLPSSECAAWVVESTDAIPVGADLSKCHHHFVAWLMLESGLLAVNDVNRSAIEMVGHLHRRAVSEPVTAQQCSAAESAACSAACSAAESAAWSAAWSAASAACSAARSALSAAESALSAAENAAWSTIAAKSIEIFAAAPVVGEQVIEPAIEQELCCRNLWCREGQLISV